ncbi:MAG: hypothetical protein KGH75_00570 [Rhodospirillales bacterium]|nr:hypothetical protein [Rhodospirillales bacterium]
MGFFAAELAQILRAHGVTPNASPWATLARMHLHPQLIDRLKKAADDPEVIAAMPEPHLAQLRAELELSLNEQARLQAGIEADVMLRMMRYHSYPLNDAMHVANGVFAAMLKDRLANQCQTITYAETSDAVNDAIIAGRGRRGRGIRRRVEAPQEDLP